jgi:hypothetical protein
VEIKPGQNAASVTTNLIGFFEDFGAGAVISTINVSSANEWAAAKTDISNGGNDKNYIINVTAGFVEIAADLDSNTFGSVTGIKVSLRGAGTATVLTLTRDENNIGNLLRIGDEQMVILRGLTLRGHNLNVANLVVMKDDATFIMRSGKISGNSGNMSQGGGVYMEDGTFTMYGGEISGNNAITGGGVAVAGGIFTMNGGTISGNNGGGNGGGVAVAGGTFTMNGGTISGNIGQDAGGGVHVRSGTLTMNGGTISGNETYGSGGGVHVSTGTFQIVTGTIYGSNEAVGLPNTANQGGAALFVTDYGVAQRGTFAADGTEWNGLDLETTNDTIRVRNGVMQ